MGSGDAIMSENQRKDDILKETSEKHRYTYGDYLTWDDEQRYELIDGIIHVMSPAPGRRHRKLPGKFIASWPIIYWKKNVRCILLPLM